MARTRRRLVCAAVLALAFGSAAAVVPAEGSADAAGPVKAAAVTAVPRPDHVVVVVEENHAGVQIVGAPAAPYISSLATHGANFTASYALTHPSEPNYLAMFSGSTQGLTDDSCPHSYATPSLGGSLITAGFGFAGYSETLPSQGYTGCNSGKYARKHSPWINFPAIPASANKPFSAFPSDYSTLPDVSFVIPNLDNDMHDGTIAQGDSWLQSNLAGYAAWAMTHNSLLVVTFDEDDHSASNRIATVFYGQQIVQGNYAETINHYNVLRTLEDAYGLPAAGASATADPILDIWGAPSGDQPPTAAFSSSCQGTSCSFDAGDSSDPDGTLTGYQWAFGDGTTAAGPTPSHTYPSTGQYTVTLTVSDDGGATDDVSHLVSIAGSDPFVVDTFNRSVTNGLGRADTGGAWSITGGASSFSVAPGAATLRAPAGKTLTASLPTVTRTDADVLAAESLSAVPTGGAVTLAVQGRRVGSGNSYAAKVAVNANRTVAVRTARVVGGKETKLAGPVTVTGLTYSPGTVLDVRVQVTGTSPTLVRARVWPSTGTEPAAWQVSSNDSTAGLQSAGSVGLTTYTAPAVTNAPISVAVKSLTATPTTTSGNQPPTAVITASCAQLTCSFSGASSSDPDGSVTGWSWTFGDGTSGTGVQTQHAYTLGGTYTVTLLVTDAQGSVDSATKSVVATTPPVDQPPTARFTSSCQARSCTFNGTGSTDDEDVVGWSWNFGDGSFATGAMPSHDYGNDGTYTVQLTVTDNEDATDSISHDVSVGTGTATAFASDSFARTVSNGLGTADVGGVWTTSGTASSFSVASGSASLRLAKAGAQLKGYLQTATSAGADVLVGLTLDKVPVGAGVYLAVIGRRVTSGNEYSARLLFNADRSVGLRLTRVVGGASTDIGGPVRLTGVTYSAGMVLNLRMQATGAGPTTVRARAWPAGGTEPATWQVSVTDSTAALQDAGSIGVSAFLLAGATNAPVTAGITSLTATAS